MITTDIVIVGGGIIGLSVARELNNRHPDLKITLVEKESDLACHASGRNSGVLHAGFYYTPDSLKSRFTAEGNRLLTDYCLRHNLAINRCGKIVVANDEKELETLYELKKRGDINRIGLEIVDEKRLKELEPTAKTFREALYSPTTSIVDPKQVIEHIAQSLQGKVNIFHNERLIERETASTIRTTTRKIKFRHLINCAGPYADKIAHHFGVGQKYTLIPFKGLYLEYKDSAFIRKHIYRVPNLKNPFLGVHFTKMTTGKIKVGPTAVPAFWRENYQGLSNFNLKEFFEIVFCEAKLFFPNTCNFRDLTFEEMRKYSRKYFIQQAASLVNKIDANCFGNYLPSGIRAQLLDRENMKLVMDFVVEHGENSTHVLNAVSPAFTSAFSFNKFVVDEVEKKTALGTKR